MGHLSLRKLYQGILEGRLPDWGPQRVCKVKLWKWVSVSIGAPILGNMERRSFPSAFERRGKKSFI
jgi:hypothetical protein